MKTFNSHMSYIYRIYASKYSDFFKKFSIKGSKLLCHKEEKKNMQRLLFLHFLFSWLDIFTAATNILSVKFSGLVQG